MTRPARMVRSPFEAALFAYERASGVLGLSPLDVGERAWAAMLKRMAAACAAYDSASWQLIESAPRDGTVLDVWVRWVPVGKALVSSRGHRVPNARWMRTDDGEGWGYSEALGNDVRDVLIEREDLAVIELVTHWRLPPQGPEQPSRQLGRL